MSTTSISKAGIPTRETVGHREKRFGKTGMLVVGAVVLCLALVLLFRGSGEKQKPNAERPPRPVEFSKVIQRDVPLYLNAIGTTTAVATVNVQPQVTGQIIAREFEDGADVKKGDLLFRIDPRPYEAVLAAAKADLALAEANLARQTELRAKNVATSQEIDTARANAMRTKASVAAAEVNFDFCNIKSPIDGRAGLRNVDVGNVVTPGPNAVLLTIQGMDPIYTDFTVPEPDLPLVRRYVGGAPLKVLTDAEGDNVPPREGELSFLDQAVQPGTGTIKARSVTPNPDRALWPSQFVRVQLILDTLKNAKLVPSGAVQIGQNGPYVFVVKDDSTLDLRQVKPGQTHEGDLTVIEEGVELGEKVVVAGQLQLAPGAKVSAKEYAPIARGRERGGSPGSK